MSRKNIMFGRLNKFSFYISYIFLSHTCITRCESKKRPTKTSSFHFGSLSKLVGSQQHCQDQKIDQNNNISTTIPLFPTIHNENIYPPRPKGETCQVHGTNQPGHHVALRCRVVGTCFRTRHPGATSVDGSSIGPNAPVEIRSKKHVFAIGYLQ